MASNNDSCFISAPGFCPDCGSILPLLGEEDSVICYACKRKWGYEGTFQIIFIVVKKQIFYNIFICEV